MPQTTNYPKQTTNDEQNQTPFMDLLPPEIKCEIISFLPIQSWNSLFNVNKEWQQLITTEANSYLNSIKNKLQQLQSYDLDTLMKNLLSKVNDYYQRTRHRASEVEDLNLLEKEVSLFKSPLAKLLRYEEKINEIQKMIEKEYHHSPLFFIFSPRNSNLHRILQSESPQCLKEVQSAWFKKARGCTELSPNHTISKLFANAFLEIQELKNSTHEMKTHNVTLKN